MHLRTTLRTPGRRAVATVAAAGLATLAAGSVLSSGPAAGSDRTATHVPATKLAARAVPALGDRQGRGDVSANLFEWSWPSVATECRTVLGPAGYGSVQVAPPQDSLKRTSLGNGSDTVLHPWWEVYQPVDYNLTSRMGSPQQFKDMVGTCRKAGVKVIVDAVVNHMTGQGDTSYGGQGYTKYDYAGLYTPDNFHSYPKDCPVAPDAGTGSREGNIADFNDYTQVFNCELVGLSDLDTSQPYVRARLAAYLNKLLSYGVSGFRVDAAKHIGQVDLAAIEKRLHRTVDGDRPYLALEVGSGSPGRISAAAFTGVGHVLGFDYASQLQSAFKSYNSPPNDGNIGDLSVLGEGSGLLPSADELVFVENHDTERNGSTLNYKDPSNTLANQFMLAWPYGTPQVYASFAWDATDASPPSRKDGMVTRTVCDGSTWVCVDRFPGVTGLVGFHNRVGDAPVTAWWDNGANVVAFSRGKVGFFAANNTDQDATVTVRTTLPRGTYCDVAHGVTTGGVCSGATVRVTGAGRATVTLQPHDAIAFTRWDKVS